MTGGSGPIHVHALASLSNSTNGLQPLAPRGATLEAIIFNAPRTRSCSCFGIIQAHTTGLSSTQWSHNTGGLGLNLSLKQKIPNIPVVALLSQECVCLLDWLALA